MSVLVLGHLVSEKFIVAFHGPFLSQAGAIWAMKFYHGMVNATLLVLPLWLILVWWVLR